MVHCCKPVRERQISYDIYMWNLKKKDTGTSLVAQWLRVHLSMQGTWVQSPVREDPTCLSPCAKTTEPAL